ncbi:MAG: enoyl-CoA hydratase/isomerase family protein [Deltaproteobacteria bacterium]|nr:enoyl-CoA hydratase/isomerase family protein [bacterium]MCB9475869.1 enoyl-CoA hydratase/isomerase family protein [Deltaproteobacteria bacterium]MCB9490062.1 enoyl-CoA hydratase/isomerase family protein [Deltaproteobacteria bacterium]
MIWFDNPKEAVNTVSFDLIDAFNSLMDDLDKDPKVKAIVLISAKDDCFIAGADLASFARLKSAKEAEEASRRGHKALDRLALSAKPCVAAINGTCLGGGLEIALACHYRIATTHPKTVLGLPEVKLGLLPAGGGTQRLPQLIELQEALDMMLTGKNVYPKKARKMGLIDDVTSPFGLAEKAATAAKRLVAKGDWSRDVDKGLADKVMKEIGPARKMVISKAAELTERKARGNYPAPIAILECVEAGLEGPREKGYEVEARNFAKIATGPVSEQLINLFFAMTGSKKHPLAKGAPEVKHVGVLGAGLMGAGIALVTADNAKTSVIMKDIAPEALAKGQQYIYKSINKRLQKGAVEKLEHDKINARAFGTLDYADLARADLIIEAVFEEIELKKRVLKDTEAVTNDKCVFASNTSALPIGEIAKASKRPETVLGMHYFSPVEKMPLLEIITTPKTAKWAVQKAVAFGIKQGKTVIVVKDGPGFYTTRILAPYMNETCLLLDEGAIIPDLEKAMLDWGFPVGPIALVDEVGIDVAAHVGTNLGEFFRKTRGEFPHATGLPRMAEAGYAGRKNNKGFYRYNVTTKSKALSIPGITGGKKGKEPNEAAYEFFGGPDRKKIDKKLIQDRLALAFVNEAALCLQEEVISNPADGDLGAILGLGFPPFRGGPFRYVDATGASNIVKRLEELAGKHGPQFKPAQILVDNAKKGATFYKK